MFAELSRQEEYQRKRQPVHQRLKRKSWFLFNWFCSFWFHLFACHKIYFSRSHPLLFPISSGFGRARWYNWKDMRIVNRKYNREYTTLEKFEVGIVLSGAEVKSIREEQLKIDDAFVKIIGNEAFLINAEIQIYKFARPHGYDPRRSRKLLLHKKELLRLQTKMSASKGLTVAPLACYNKGHLIKLEIALAKGKTDIEKRRHEKARDITRAIDKEIKEYERS